MIIQEEKVEIVDDKKNLVPQQEKNVIIHKEKIHKPVGFYIGVFLGTLILILLFIFAAFTIFNIQNNNIITNGVYIYGIDVSGLNKAQAKQKLAQTFDKIEKTDIKLVANNYEVFVHPSEINLKYNTDAAINYAFSIGKTGNIFSDDYEIFNTMINGVKIMPTYSIDESALLKTLDDFSKNLPNPVIESSYYIEGKELIITKGSDGYAVDVTQTALNIKNKLVDLSFLSQPVELYLKKQSPKDVDLDKIYSEVHKEAKDAYFTKNPYAVYPSENGIDFKISLAEAKKGLASAKKEYTIPLKTVYPKITTNKLGKEAFPHLLGEFSTTYSTSQTNRSTNLRIAAEKINGTVILPGETFEYNKVVGERTISAGFKEAGIYVNGELVDGLGGGVCQISTTVFNAALLANMKITEVYYHPYVSSYASIGRDATVAYGQKDLKFKNTRNYAIRIECKASGGVAKCKIYGFKQNPEYEVKISTNITSRAATYTKCSTYRSLYLNGKKVSSELIYNCTYKKH